MGVKTGNALHFNSGIAALAFLGLLSSVAYCQNRPSPPSTQIWADPGAIEKARKEATTQDQNKVSAPSPALPAPSSASTERISAPSPHKPATRIQTSSISGGERMSKLVHGPAEHLAIHRLNHHNTETNHNHASSSGPVLASQTGHKISAAPGHINNAPRSQPHAANHVPNSTARAGAQHVANDSLPNKKDGPSPAAAAGEFDPVYGYSNMISVAY